MTTMRRFLVLTPVAFIVTAVPSVYLAPVIWLEGTGAALLIALAVTAVALAAVLVAVWLLRLRDVHSAWAALGLAVVLFAVVCALVYVAVAQPWPSGAGWGAALVVVGAIASIPAWLAYAVGLLVGDLRHRAARGQSAAV
ncbi:hypothetical protein [Promicromonospora panici]|uniref:hypothetical protein n=1 Tax=Promicromonospora panici TaxID=2219658 RepID=UPI00101CCD39|nr:hypothetical protein [Promicromonospora panici]